MEYLGLRQAACTHTQWCRKDGWWAATKCIVNTPRCLRKHRHVLPCSAGGRQSSALGCGLTASNTRCESTGVQGKLPKDIDIDGGESTHTCWCCPTCIMTRGGTKMAAATLGCASDETWAQRSCAGCGTPCCSA